MNTTENEPPPPEPEPPRRTDKRIRERLQLRGLAKTRRGVADMINDILDRMAQLELRGGDNLGATIEAPIFEELMGCDFMLVDEIIEGHTSLVAGGKYVILNPDQLETELADACWPIDQGTITRQEDGYFMSRTRSVTAKEIRGRAQLFAPKMIRDCYLKMYDDGRWFAGDHVAGLMNGRWVPLDRNLRTESRRGGSVLTATPNQSASHRQEIHDSTSGIFSLALSRRYSWHVALGTERDGPRILVPTNPQGCLQFFKDRERGKRSRRAALRHWVAKYYRNNDQTGLAFVREHLRGQTEFRWTDLECEIFVSAFDLEKNEEFRLEAEHWRAQRKHNRVRVRLKRRN
jgi:hypothetical protein